VVEKSLRGFLAVGERSLGSAIAGIPKTVLDKLIADYQYLGGFRYIISGVGRGNATCGPTLRHTMLFKNEVMPVFKKYYEQKTKKLSS